MAKAGDAYQEAVAQVARSIDPHARVEVGEWIEGPDGERDMDVSVWPAGQDSRFILIECKDWKKPVGISTLDALESKRRDLNVIAAMVCSNSGFTEPSLRKAGRVGIPALSALIEGDERIRIEVQEEVFTKRITFRESSGTYHFTGTFEPTSFPSVTPLDFLFQNRSIDAWCRRESWLVMTRSSRSRRCLIKYAFREPIDCVVRGQTFGLKGFDIKLRFDVQWLSHIARIDSSTGMYDHLRHRVLVGPGPTKYMIRDIDPNKGTPLPEFPGHLPVGSITSEKPLDPRVLVSISFVEGFELLDGVPVPDLSPFVATREVIDEASGQAISCIDDSLLW